MVNNFSSIATQYPEYGSHLVYSSADTCVHSLWKIDSHKRPGYLLFHFFQKLIGRSDALSNSPVRKLIESAHKVLNSNTLSPAPKSQMAGANQHYQSLLGAEAHQIAQALAAAKVAEAAKRAPVPTPSSDVLGSSETKLQQYIEKTLKELEQRNAHKPKADANPKERIVENHKATTAVAALPEPSSSEYIHAPNDSELVELVRSAQGKPKDPTIQQVTWDKDSPQPKALIIVTAAEAILREYIPETFSARTIMGSIRKSRLHETHNIQVRHINPKQPADELWYLLNRIFLVAKPQLLIIACHGEPNAMHLTNHRDQKILSNSPNPLAESTLGQLPAGCNILLASCSTGKPTEGGNMLEFFSKYAPQAKIAAPVDTIIGCKWNNTTQITTWNYSKQPLFVSYNFIGLQLLVTKIRTWKHSNEDLIEVAAKLFDVTTASILEEIDDFHLLVDRIRSNISKGMTDEQAYDAIFVTRQL